LLLVAVLILTQNVWARQAAAPNAPGPSATTVNYQGRLADDAGVPLTGTYGMSFALYDAVEGGTLIWGPENHTAVPVSEGLFSVGLGSQTSGGIPTTTWNGDRYLEITVGGETLSPRELIRSVPIAGMALTVPDGAIEAHHLATGGFGASNKPLMNFVPTNPQSVLRLENQSDIDFTLLDLTDYTSETATNVMLWVCLRDVEGTATMIFRVSGMQYFLLRNFSTEKWSHDHFVIAMDSQQRLEYKLDAVGENTASFEIYVIGYWEPVTTQ
jgi:hypothetical protein